MSDKILKIKLCRKHHFWARSAVFFSIPLNVDISIHLLTNHGTGRNDYPGQGPSPTSVDSQKHCRSYLKDPMPRQEYFHNQNFCPTPTCVPRMSPNSVWATRERESWRPYTAVDTRAPVRSSHQRPEEWNKLKIT